MRAVKDPDPNVGLAAGAKIDPEAAAETGVK
jgi:hypothetical protein